jgi:transcriptional regulator with XRE-family HTH domain
MMERGDRVPHLETLANLADALRVPLPEMFLGLGESESSRRLLDSLIEFLEHQPLDAAGIEVLLVVAKAMFKDKRSSSSP